MRILGIETSCDETASAVVENGEVVLSNVVASSLELYKRSGGIIPEIAAREQVKYILPVIEEALKGAGIKSPTQPRFFTKGRREIKIDAIAVTYGPGLIGSLLVGVETAKTLSFVWNKPLIAVNHMHGHIYANFICEISNVKSQMSNLDRSRFCSKNIEFPALALVVSGGHTDLLLMKTHGEFEVLGGTRDDAAGEAFDKIGRLLGLPYPAGPVISKLAENGNAKGFDLPRPMINSEDFEFSFSGLKTAVLNLVKKDGSLFRVISKSETMRDLSEPQKISFRQPADRNDKVISGLCAAVEQAVVDVLVAKTIKAAQAYQVKSILLGGGVAANSLLRNELKIKSEKLNISLYIPSPNLCTDNAAMIAAAAFYTPTKVSFKDLNANPQLYY